METTKEPRIAYMQVAPEGFKAMRGLEAYVSHSSIEAKLSHLVKLRVSMINGCAYCIDMHWKDLRAMGESEARLYGLNSWEETPLYTEREEAALALAEAVTLVSQGHVPDAVFERARQHFNEKELVDLTYGISTINAWNRLAITFRATPGQYQSRLGEKKNPSGPE